MSGRSRRRERSSRHGVGTIRTTAQMGNSCVVPGLARVQLAEIMAAFASPRPRLDDPFGSTASRLAPLSDTCRARRRVVGG